MRPLRLALPLALAAAFAGCGEKEEPTGTLPNEPPATSPTAPPERAEVLGHFRGRLTQRGLQPFRIDVRIRSLRQSARNPVRYSGLGCSGRWAYRTRDGDTYRFRELITSGRSEKCKGAGTVTLRQLSPNRFAYRFRGGGVSSRGTLVRVAPR